MVLLLISDGNFKIQVKNENATLKISYIGMVAQNIRVGNQRNIKVVLKDESQKINEVVACGLRSSEEGECRRCYLSG